MRMPKRLLPALGLLFVVTGLMQGISTAGAALGRSGEGGGDVLAGCRDIPEVAAMVEQLDIRATRLSAYQTALERRKADIATAEATLTAKLRQLKAVHDRFGGGEQSVRSDVADDIDRLIGVYDAMKPRDAAAVLGSLPPEFAAEILMRVDPAIGAQILAAVEPAEAAILTTHMGARHVRSN